jgi:hypothetical protein
MGYPIYLNLQSGLFYPPYWWFVVTGTTYTVDAAILMQGMHVLFGAVGATLCARLLNMRWALALLAAVVYQSFGGFYSTHRTRISLGPMRCCLGYARRSLHLGRTVGCSG